MKSNALAKLDEEIIANEIIKFLQYRLDHPQISVRKACEELGMNYRRTLMWLNDGKLSDYLDQIHDLRSDLAQVVALNNLPKIVEIQAQIATGEITLRGANPTTAASFVLEVARLGSKNKGLPRVLSQTNVFIPVMEKEKDDAPVVDAPSRVVSPS